MTEPRRKRPSEPPRPPEPAASPKVHKPSAHPIGTPRGTSSNSAIIAVGAWLAARGIYPPMARPWHIEIAIGIANHPVSYGADATGTRFQLRFNAQEWGFMFCHDNRMSSIRVHDVPFVSDRDDHHLITHASLKDIGALIRQLEQRHGICFQRRHATVRTDLAGAEPIVRSWIATL